MRQKNGFDQFLGFKSKGIEFEVGDKYLLRQLTSLLIRQSCQACSSKPLARNIMKDVYFLVQEEEEEVERVIKSKI
jgi:hypothetical protein